MTTTRAAGASGGRRGGAVAPFDSLPDLGHVEAQLTAVVPGLRHIMRRDTTVINETIQRRTRDAELVGNDLCCDQRFFLHTPSLPQTHCLTVYYSGTMRQLDCSTPRQLGAVNV